MSEQPLQNHELPTVMADPGELADVLARPIALPRAPGALEPTVIAHSLEARTDTTAIPEEEPLYVGPPLLEDTLPSPDQELAVRPERAVRAEGPALSAAPAPRPLPGPRPSMPVWTTSVISVAERAELEKSVRAGRLKAALGLAAGAVAAGLTLALAFGSTAPQDEEPFVRPPRPPLVQVQKPAPAPAPAAPRPEAKPAPKKAARTAPARPAKRTVGPEARAPAEQNVASREDSVARLFDER